MNSTYSMSHSLLLDEGCFCFECSILLFGRACIASNACSPTNVYITDNVYIAAITYVTATTHIPIHIDNNVNLGKRLMLLL